MWMLIGKEASRIKMFDLLHHYIFRFVFFFNSINTDGLSALDVAVLSNNRSMTKMLLQHGALEGSQCKFNYIKLHLFVC